MSMKWHIETDMLQIDGKKKTIERGIMMYSQAYFFVFSSFGVGSSFSGASKGQEPHEIGFKTYKSWQMDKMERQLGFIGDAMRQAPMAGAHC